MCLREKITFPAFCHVKICRFQLFCQTLNADVCILNISLKNKAVARARANRVKSELILHQGLTEKCFVTHSHADKGDWVNRHW